MAEIREQTDMSGVIDFFRTLGLEGAVLCQWIDAVQQYDSMSRAVDGQTIVVINNLGNRYTIILH